MAMALRVGAARMAASVRLAVCPQRPPTYFVTCCACLPGNPVFLSLVHSAPTRALATAPDAQSGLVSPGIQLYGLEGRYAHALFSAASKNNALGQVEKELTAVQGSLKADASFAGFLESPVLNSAERVDSVNKIMGAWKMSETTKNFFVTLAENNRLAKAGGVITSFQQLMSASRNEVICTVTSAEALNSTTQNSLKKSLSAFAPGQEINFDYVVDPEIIGGVIVELGADKYIDMSTRSKVNKLVKELSAPI